MNNPMGRDAAIDIVCEIDDFWPGKRTDEQKKSYAQMLAPLPEDAARRALAWFKANSTSRIPDVAVIRSRVLMSTSAAAKSLIPGDIDITQWERDLVRMMLPKMRLYSEHKISIDDLANEFAGAVKCLGVDHLIHPDVYLDWESLGAKFYVPVNRTGQIEGGPLDRAKAMEFPR